SRRRRVGRAGQGRRGGRGHSQPARGRTRAHRSGGSSGDRRRGGSACGGGSSGGGGQEGRTCQGRCEGSAREERRQEIVFRCCWEEGRRVAALVFSGSDSWVSP